MKGPYCRKTEQGMCVWEAERLWKLAESLPVRHIPLSDLPALEEVRWFHRTGGDPRPTCKAIAAHARLIYDADLSYPIILSASGDVMDGMHRIARAYLLGHEEIAAVQFTQDPEPDRIVLHTPTERPPSLFRRILTLASRRRTRRR